MQFLWGTGLGSESQTRDENPQFQNYRFWKNVDEEIISGIVKAIDKASAEALRKKIAKLEGEIAGLRNQL